MKKTKEKDLKDNNQIGIKLPWWIGYTILIIVFSLSTFLIYKVIISKFAIETSAIIDNTQTINSDEIKVQEIILDKTDLELLIGEEKQIIANIIPDNATNKELIWKSNDEDVATVENGNIKGIKEGETTIAISDINETKKVYCTIKVKPIEVSSLNLDETSVNIGVGQSYILTGFIEPNNATNTNIIWSSSNENLLTVNNGQIHAISEGDATITITSSNGKTANCKFHITTNCPSNTIKYVTSTFNVRSGPGTNYKTLASTSRNDEIEILKEESSWAKLRLSNGIVGYTVLKSYSSSKTYYIENVPYINQFSLGYPTGCEAVSATMAANFAGYSVNASTIVANTPTDTLGKRQEKITKEIQTEIKKEVPIEKQIQQNVVNETTGETEVINTTITENETKTEIQTTTQEETAWIGGNPFQVFVGHPTKKLAEGSYGCFAAPIATALSKSGVSCSNISGCSIDTVFSYIQQGKPIIVWCKKNAGDLTEGVTWKYPDESGEFTELVGEHCAVLIGYDGEYVYLNDPSAGKGVKQVKWKFTSNWYKLYSQAIVIN